MIRITNATAVEFDPPRVRPHTEILVEGSAIRNVSVGSVSDVAPDQIEESIDAAGALVYPGLVCSHHHIYSALARGIIAEIGSTPDFISILKKLWWRIDQATTEASLRASASLCARDAVRAGTTAIVDHHASPRFISGSLSTIQESFESVGVRGTTCYEVTDRHGHEGMIAGIKENADFARHLDGEKSAGTWRGLVEAHIGGHAAFTLPDDGLEAIADVVQSTNRGFHVHVAEDLYDQSHGHAIYGEDLISRLARHNLLSERTLIAHGIFLDEDQIELFNQSGGFLLHNARSNMNNGVGYNSRLARFQNVALGTDGIGGDMFAELGNAYFKHRDDRGDLGPDWFVTALAAGNRILETSFGRPFGRLDPGYTADIVINDYDPPTPLSAQNLAGHLVFGPGSSGTRTVIINGNIVYRDGRFPFETAPLNEEARREAQALWQRVNEISP